MRTVGRAPWGDLVMHVLAHVRATARLAPSLYDARYCAWAAAALGDPAERCLARDAETLGAMATTHQALAQAQLVAWLFETKERARACEGRALGEIGEADVDRPELLPSVRTDAGEMLWCAALLEDETHARLPEISPAPIEAIDAMTAIAPMLAECTFASLRALRVRGRVFRDAIWIGTPSTELDVDVEHVAWQAAHEATVREASRTLHGHDAVEAAALELMATRAKSAGLAERHAVWRSRFA